MLNHLSLTNFRNYPKATFDFGQISILIGPNGIGKTNIAEAIYLLATGRSWRTNKDSELILWDEDFFAVRAEFTDEELHHLDLIVQKNGRGLKKTIKVNQVPAKLADFLGQMPAVLFSPEEIALVSGAPAFRRRFLDILLCETDKKYLANLLELGKVLKNRNSLLLQIKMRQAKEKELDFWDEKLIENGQKMIEKRTKLIKTINPDLTAAYREISGQKEELILKYHPSVISNEFSEMLAAHREREIAASASLFGPHRDDLVFLLDGRDLSTFGSRGEYRTAILALKVAEMNYLKTVLERPPMLILDDIFSELDASRRAHLAGIIKTNQTIITTTDLDHIEEKLQKKAKIIELQRTL